MSFHKMLLATASALALLTAPLAAQDNTEDAVEDAAQATQDAAGDAMNAAQDAADDAADATQQAAQDAADATEDAAGDAANAAQQAAQTAGEAAGEVASDASEAVNAAASGSISEKAVAAMPSNGMMASTFMNASVTNPAGEEIGDVNDIIVTSEGQLEAVLIGVGGFIGIGEKNVAVSLEDIKINHDETGTLSLVLNASVEELEAAPVFGGGPDIDAEADQADGTATSQ